MNDLCFLDLETTGFEPTKDSIIEVSFIRIKDGEEITRFDQVIVPDKSPLTAFVAHLTGISEAEIKVEGKSLVDVKDEITKKIGDSVIVGHNIDFDINFLVGNGIDVSGNPRLDTHELSRILLPQEESFALEVISQKYGFFHEEAHRAMSDVEACVELYDFLKQKIEGLPPKFLSAIKDFLETKTDWYAKDLFLSSRGDPDFSYEKKEPVSNLSSRKIDENFWTRYKDLSSEKTIFWRIRDSIPAAEATVSVVEKIAKEKPVLLITPKLPFFSTIKKVPTPEVILDPERLEAFQNTREKLDDRETTFYLKCTYRKFLGFRGVDFFDISYQEGDFWREVHLADSGHPIFQQIIEERKSDQILSITPPAFLRFHDLDLFAGRTLIIDEAEQFTEEMLRYPTETISLADYLNSEKEETANQAMFFIKNFCRDVIEEKIGHTMGPFPERVRFSPREQLAGSAQTLVELDPKSESLKRASEILQTNETGQVRWANYFPETGNLSFCSWLFHDWGTLKKSLQNFPKICLHRHKISEKENEHFQTFLGVEDGIFFEDPVLFSDQKLEIKKDMISATNPGFNTFCGEKILEIIDQQIGKKDFLVVNFSSQEAMKNIYNQLNEALQEKDIQVLAEGVSGGNGKLLEKLKGRKEETVLFNQRFIHPDMADYPWKLIVIQKFPFAPPSPLMDAVQESFKASGKDFWGGWMIPQVAANLSRRTSVFSSAEKILFLDPRENTSWGKAILQKAF